MPTSDERAKCEVCGCHTDSRPWIALARWGVGTGTNSCYYEETFEGESLWDPDDEVMTAAVVCWPVCAQQYIEAHMVETDVLCREGGA